MNLRLGVWLMAVLMLASVRARAAPEDPSRPQWAGSFTFENDLFFGTDKYYTDGVELELKRRPVERESPTAVSAAICPFIGCKDQPLLARHHHVGQLMYTPQRIGVHEAQPDDRPWAGLLYYSHSEDMLSPDGAALTTITEEIGVVGRYSYAEQTQKWIHRTFTGIPPRGWDNQIGGEIGLMLMAERRMALPQLSSSNDDGVQLRGLWHWRAAAGNIMTFAEAGLTFVVGKDLPLVVERGPGPQTKGAFGGPSVARDRACVFSWLECTASAFVEARWVIRNMFLDGTMFRNGPSVDKRPFVADVGASLRFTLPRTKSDLTGAWYAEFRATRRTPEFYSRLRVEPQTFGALTIGTDF